MVEECGRGVSATVSRQPTGGGGGLNGPKAARSSLPLVWGSRPPAALAYPGAGAAYAARACAATSGSSDGSLQRPLLACWLACTPRRVRPWPGPLVRTQVYRAICKQYNEEVAIKLLDLENMNCSLDEIVREAQARAQAGCCCSLRAALQGMQAGAGGVQPPGRRTGGVV